jgi:hypothetical protein
MELLVFVVFVGRLVAAATNVSAPHVAVLTDSKHVTLSRSLP